METHIPVGAGGRAPGPGACLPGCSGSRSGPAIQTESGRPQSCPEVDEDFKEAMEPTEHRGDGTPGQTAGRRHHQAGEAASKSFPLFVLFPSFIY